MVVYARTGKSCARSTILSHNTTKIWISKRQSAPEAFFIMSQQENGGNKPRKDENRLHRKRKDENRLHQKILRDNFQGITRPAIRRLARRGGVKRIYGLIYEGSRVLKVFS